MTIRYAPGRGQGVSPGRNARVDFFLGRETTRGAREGLAGEGEDRAGTGRARVHSPCTHTPSTIRRPLATSTWNAIPGGR